MEFLISNGNVHFLMGGADGPKHRFVSLPKSKKFLKFIERTCEIVCAKGSGKSNYTKSAYVSSFVKFFVQYIDSLNGVVPKNSREWQDFILNFFEYYMTNDISKSSLRTRMADWQEPVRAILCELQVSSLIDPCLTIPKIRMRSEVYKSESGSVSETVTKRGNVASLDEKLLVGPNFAQTDEMFLKSVELECRNRIDLIREVCSRHWKAFLADFDSLSKNAKKISKKDLDESILVGDHVPSKRGQYFFSPTMTRFNDCPRLFAMIHREIISSDDRTCISLDFFENLPYFGTRLFQRRNYRPVLSSKSSLNSFAHSQLSILQSLYYFSGFLTSREVAAVCALLMVEHPNFNPLSLKHCKLFNERGQTHICITDKSDTLIFSVDKPRAKARKTAVLSDTASRIIEGVIRVTASLRNFLRRSNNADADYLFLVLSRGKICRVTTTLTGAFTQSNKTSMCRLYPELVEGGLGQNQFSFAKIRNTMGILRWFETGSVPEMSKCLGNSQRTTLTYYLPQSLLGSWNARIIRRFQNTLIILSSDQNCIVKNSDFTSEQQVTEFIGQLLIEFKDGSSPIADRLHALFNQSGELKETHEGLINLKVSVNSLSHLYAYSEYISKFKLARPKFFQQKSLESGLLELSRLIHHACENTSDFSPLSDILDLSLLTSTHCKAKSMKREIIKKFQKFEVTECFINLPQG
jgi:hypothetical protein